MKICIIGYSGSGKSTLASKLGQHYNIPILHLDKVNFKEGWALREREEAKSIVSKFMENKSWIIDGNYKAFFRERRLKEADKIIFLDFPRRICFFRAFKRYLENRNRTRSDMAEGCKEKFDFEFIWWILCKGRNKTKRQDYKEIIKEFKDKVIVLKRPKEVCKFLDSI